MNVSCLQEVDDPTAEQNDRMIIGQTHNVTEYHDMDCMAIKRAMQNGQQIRQITESLGITALGVSYCGHCKAGGHAGHEQDGGPQGEKRLRELDPSDVATTRFDEEDGHA